MENLEAEVGNAQSHSYEYEDEKKFHQEWDALLIQIENAAGALSQTSGVPIEGLREIIRKMDGLYKKIGRELKTAGGEYVDEVGMAVAPNAGLAEHAEAVEHGAELLSQVSFPLNTKNLNHLNASKDATPQILIAELKEITEEIETLARAVSGTV